MPSFETVSCCETASPLASKNAGSCLSVWAGPLPTVPIASVLGVRKSVVSQEIVVGILRVDGATRLTSPNSETPGSGSRSQRPSWWVNTVTRLRTLSSSLSSTWCRVGLNAASDFRSVGSNRTSNVRVPFRYASRSVAIRAPAG